MRLFLLSILLITIGAQTAAQDNPDQIFTLKPSVGISGCQVNGDNYSGYNKVGAFGGISVNAYLKERASLELGFFFSQKGSRHNAKPDKGDLSFYKLNFNYIDLPLLFRYRVKPKLLCNGWTIGIVFDQLFGRKSIWKSYKPAV